MQLKILFLFLTSVFCTLSSAEEADEIKVYLSTTSSFTPVYLADIQSLSPSFDSNYCDQLRATLLYDLRHDGSSTVIMRAEEKEKLLQHENKQIAYNSQSWKSWGAKHVVTAKVLDQSLNISLFSVHSQTLKHLPPFKLSGNFSSDRRLIHQASDILHKLMYDTSGISNSRLLYCVQKPGGREKKWISEIWECDWDGGNASQVTNEHSYCVTPAFIPSSKGNSDRFIYVSYKKGQPKIYVASLKEGEGKRLISLKGNQLLPAISPQKDRIAFICDASGRTDLFVQKLNPQSGQGNTPVQLFSYPRSTQGSPTFNPDGSKIAFVSDKDGGTRIYLIPSETSRRRAIPQLLTKKNNENSCPSWSPDGTKLAYSAKTKGVRQIWIYEFATGEERQLTDGPGNKENPAWAPDSLHLVFNSTGTEQSELYVVNLNQPEAIKITQAQEKKITPLGALDNFLEKMMNKFTYKVLPCFLMTLVLASCQKKQGTGWDDNKTASQLNRDGNSLWGSEGAGSSLTGPVVEDFIPLQEEDLKAKLADGAVPQPNEIPGEEGSSLPGANQFRAPTGELAYIFRTLHFSTDDYILRGKEQLSTIDAAAAYLKTHRKTFIFLEGHCDQRGPQAYNLALGSRRANYVRSLLVERGVDSNQLHTISYGKERPIDEHNNNEAWTKNRRAEFKIFTKP